MEIDCCEQERFKQQMVLPEIGLEGQEKLKQAKVLVVGAGGLGSPVLLYLTAAGVGYIGIVDNDTVSESNLQRQILYDTAHVGQSKVEMARERLSKLYPACCISTYDTRLSPENAEHLIAAYDIVVDATDNLAVRYLMDDVCAKLHKPMVHGSICQLSGQVAVFHYKGGPSYRDLYEYSDHALQNDQPPGVIGTLPGVVGCIQATEVIKIILDRTDVLSGKLLLLDLLKMNFSILHISD